MYYVTPLTKLLAFTSTRCKVCVYKSPQVLNSQMGEKILTKSKQTATTLCRLHKKKNA